VAYTVNNGIAMNLTAAALDKFRIEVCCGLAA
jgi:hypothetical protein